MGDGIERSAGVMGEDEIGAVAKVSVGWNATKDRRGTGWTGTRGRRAGWRYSWDCGEIA